MVNGFLLFCKMAIPPGRKDRFSPLVSRSMLPQTRRRCNPFQDHEATIAAQTPLLRGYLLRARAAFPWKEAVFSGAVTYAPVGGLRNCTTKTRWLGSDGGDEAMGASYAVRDSMTFLMHSAQGEDTLGHPFMNTV